MERIGPFFFVRNKLIYHAIPLSEGRRQTDKLDDSYGHEKLWDDHFPVGDYIDYPRGRVVWDCTNRRAIIYIDPCISKPQTLSMIAETFGLTDYIVSSDDHYRCRRCVGNLFEE